MRLWAGRFLHRLLPCPTSFPVDVELASLFLRPREVGPLRKSHHKTKAWYARERLPWYFTSLVRKSTPKLLRNMAGRDRSVRGVWSWQLLVEPGSHCWPFAASDGPCCNFWWSWELPSPGWSSRGLADPSGPSLVDPTQPTPTRPAPGCNSKKTQIAPSNPYVR